MDDQEEKQPAPPPQETDPQQSETLHGMRRTLERIAQLEPELFDQHSSR